MSVTEYLEAEFLRYFGDEAFDIQASILNREMIVVMVRTGTPLSSADCSTYEFFGEIDPHNKWFTFKDRVRPALTITIPPLRKN